MTQVFRVYRIGKYSRRPMTDDQGKVVELPAAQAQQLARRLSARHPNVPYRTVPVHPR